ncbi:TetR/AcrR family transcriptional regulator [Peribacillus tepidiphilus]|jgi:AcrR family transcriptional regulator|uniref:TetR/AcrR family transcriptional regulator n=1 Tax=Peribacillus tepidiphilus TaxID=2652445 RepID=UPI0035B55FC9
MNDKKKLILETALKLFSEKGYHSTSMQDIATECQIAKGSLYTYFQSKDELFLSIFKHSFESYREAIIEVEHDPTLSKREKFEKQIYLQLNNFFKYRDFIQKHMMDHTINKNKEMGTYMFEMRGKSLKFFEEKIVSLYGEDVIPYSFDCAVIFSGIIKEYIFLMMIDMKEQDLYRLAQFLLGRLDDIVQGCLSKKEHYLSTDDFHQLITMGELKLRSKEDRIAQLIKELHHLSTKIRLPNDKKDFLTTAIKTIEEQLANEGKEKEVIIEGMLLYLEKWDITDILKWVKQFREEWNY